jgi:GT2 family glycosyltransferase
VTVPDLSIIVACLGRPAALAGLLEALRAQTLPRARYEVLLVDDGSDPPLTRAIEPRLLDGVSCLRLEQNAGPAAARNVALERARGRLALFLNADAVPGPRLLEQHVAAHAQLGQEVAVLGRFDFAPGCRTPFVELAERAGVFFPFQRLVARRPQPPIFFWTCNLSVPLAAVRRAGGFDPAFRQPKWEDVELGYRLGQGGVLVHYLPELACAHDHPVELSDLLRSGWLIGHEWVRLVRKHGQAACPLFFDGPVSLDAALGRRLLQALVEEEEAHAGHVADVRRWTALLDEAGPAARPELLRRYRRPFVDALRALDRHEARRGIAGALLGFTAAELARDRAAARLAVGWRGPRGPALEAALRDLPPGAELWVAGADDGSLPDGVRALTSPPGSGAAELLRALAEACSAEVLALVQGDRAPAPADWARLRRYLDVAPIVCAAGLSPREGERARAVDELPGWVQAARRRELSRLQGHTSLTLAGGEGVLVCAAGPSP